MEWNWKNPIPVVEVVKLIEEGAPEQRSPEWFEERKGCFTGSANHKLMGKTAKTRDTKKRQYTWEDNDRLLDLNTIALKYIYSKARERMTGKVISLDIGKNGKHGEIAEPEITNKFLELNKDFTFETASLVKHEKYPFLGASPDGLLTSDKMYVAEFKMPVGWDGEYDRVIEPVIEGSKDFWQLVSEMCVTGADSCIYVTGVPDTTVDGEFVEVTDINTEIVERSKVHEKALITRARIGNDIIEKYIELGHGRINWNNAVAIVLEQWETKLNAKEPYCEYADPAIQEIRKQKGSYGAKVSDNELKNIEAKIEKTTDDLGF